MNGSRILMGIAACLLVAAAAVALGRAGLLPPVGPWAIFLLCPLVHLGMMVFMGRGCHQGHDHGQRTRDSKATGVQAGTEEV